MLPDRDFSRLAKTIRLMDSPIAGERAAALEAVCRQLETLGLSWADVAPKFENLDVDPGTAGNTTRRNETAREFLSNTCAWLECSQTTLKGSSFCEIHIASVVREPLRNCVSFLKRLPNVIDAKIAGNALYHAVHTAVHTGAFNRFVGHDLMRAATASRGGNGVAATVEKLLTTTGASEQAELTMHLKRQLVIPERRSVRREAAA